MLDPHSSGFERILRGESSWAFLPEALLRILFLYLLTLGCLRLMGRRMASQLSRNELLAVVSLAGAIGPAAQSPEQGLLPPVIVAALVVLLQRTLTFCTFRSHGFESRFDGTVSTLVSNGSIDLAELRRCSLSPERLYSALRGAGVVQLGEVDLVLFEVGGAFTIVRRLQEGPGLPVVPRWDDALRQAQHVDSEFCSCTACGMTFPAPHSGARSRCAGSTFQVAVCGRA